MSCKMMLMSALPSQISKSSGLGTFHPSERARWSAAAPAHPLPQAGEGKRQRRGGWTTRLSAFRFPFIAESEPKRTSSGAWLRNRLYGWLCICLRKHDRAENRSHRRFRRDAMVLGGVVRRIVWHHSGAKRVARTDFYVHLSRVGRGRERGERVRGIQRCRFTRSVPPHPPRTFGARLPLPTRSRKHPTSGGEREKNTATGLRPLLVMPGADRVLDGFEARR